MQALKIISKSGSSISRGEIEAAHRVANTHREMRFGIIVLTDKLTEVLVEYFPFKNLCFTTPASGIPLSFVYRMNGNYEELVFDASYLMLPSYEEFTYAYPSGDIQLFENKKRIRLDGLDRNGIALPYNSLLDSSMDKADIISYIVIDSKFYGQINTNTDLSLSEDLFKVLVINDLNNADLFENHSVISIPVPDDLPGGFSNGFMVPCITHQSFIGTKLYLSIFYGFTTASFETKEGLAIYELDSILGTVNQSTIPICSDVNDGPSSTLFGEVIQRSKVYDSGIYTASTFITIVLGVPNYDVSVFKNSGLIASFPLLYHPEDPASNGLTGMYSLYDLSASSLGNHYIVVLSESSLSTIYDPSGISYPYFYIGIDGVQTTYTPKSFLTRVVDGLDFNEIQNLYFDTILTPVSEDLGGNFDRTAITETGKWCCALFSTGYARENSLGKPVITTNIIHMINGIMYEYSEVVFHQGTTAQARAYITSGTDSFSYGKSFVTPDELYAIILSPVYQNRDLGETFLNTTPGFVNNLFEDYLLKVSVYSLETNLLIDEAVVSTAVMINPLVSSSSIGADTKAPSTYRLSASGGGYRLEISSDLYAYIDITLTLNDNEELALILSEIECNTTVVNPLSDQGFGYNIPGIASGNRQISPIYINGRQRLSNFYP
jgi:hypothetical protein